MIGLAALGVGVEHLVGALATELSAAERLLVCGAVSSSLLALAVLSLTTSAKRPRLNRKQASVRVAGATLALLLVGASGLSPVLLSGALMLLSVGVVSADAGLRRAGRDGPTLVTEGETL